MQLLEWDHLPHQLKDLHILILSLPVGLEKLMKRTCGGSVDDNGVKK